MRELVIQAREDEDCCFKIVKAFEPLIKKCIRLYLRDMSYYEDAMQEGRIIIIKSIENYDIKSTYPFEAYVKHGMNYGIRDFCLKIKFEISLDEPFGEEGGRIIDMLESSEAVEDNRCSAEDIKWVRETLNKLSEKQRQVIIDIYFNKKSMVEISQNRRCHYMNVVKLKKIAIEKLRALREKREEQ